MKPRILLLSYAFPPTAAPEAVLSAKRLGNLPDFDVDVICADPAGSGIRVDSSLDSYVSSRFERIERIQIPPVLAGLLGRKISAIFQVPGLTGIMNRRALRIARRWQPSRYAMMMTWSQWHSIHLVGLALKRQFPKLPWIAHFSDPWADNPFSYGGLVRLYSRRLEAKVFEAADCLSFTSPETIDLVFSGRRAAYRPKIVNLPHSFEPGFYPASSPPSDGPIILRSVGNFYGARSPKPFSLAIRKMQQCVPALVDKLRIELVGSMPKNHQIDLVSELPPNLVRLVPSVDYRTSLALMQSSDLLLNIDAPFEHSVFLPSKLVDYIGAGRPIVGITPPGTAARIIRELGGWVADPRDPDEVADALISAITFVERHRGRPWGDAKIRSTYMTSTVAAQFNDIIQACQACAR